MRIWFMRIKESKERLLLTIKIGKVRDVNLG